jgi:GTP cyclohydrolase II
MEMGDKNLTRLIGEPYAVAVERALAELRSGRPVVLTAEGADYLVAAAEETDEAALAVLREAGSGARLVLSPPRLRALGLEGAEPGAIALDDLTAETIQELISHTEPYLNGHIPGPAGKGAKAAIELVRLAFMLPAAILVPLAKGDAPSALIRVDETAMEDYRKHVQGSPHIVSRAPVPLDEVGESEFVVFRGGEGMRDQVAIVIGNPDPAQPVYTRLHSACLTGDLFGSLKCDCGDQLRGTVKFMAENGGGVLLYLDQEGRGNGIANKIRAYCLQHAGYNTFESDNILGFGHDQRHFDFAAEMLKQLGFSSVKLLTNNPVKVKSLEDAGLNVVSSHRVKARSTLQNVGYLAAKRDHAGHLIEKDLKY